VVVGDAGSVVVGGAGSTVVGGGDGGISGFVSAGGASVEAGGGVSSCFTFLFLLLFFPFFLALGKIQPHGEHVADSR
jgi:hypothetical protein